MMPVSGEWNAATHDSAGSIAVASAPVNMRRPSTPFVVAWAKTFSNAPRSPAPHATTSLPSFLCGTPWDAQ